MDNFQKNQPKHPRSSVDGILNSGPAKPSIASASFTPATGVSQPERNRLDDFSGTNGFRAAKQPVLNGSEPPAGGRNPRRNSSGIIDLSLPPAPKKPRARKTWK